MDNLQKFLNTKTLFYDKIDYDTISKSYDILKHHINLPFVIHIVGTNGKGSTGRYIADFLYQLNFSVLHYSSPHILKFNERIWIDGQDSTNTQLEYTHQQLQTILTAELLSHLTYFEYTTLLALVLSSKKDYLILEAGLGGEFDATNVVTNNISVFTPIGIDHTEFLGNSLEQIATTKFKSCNNCYIIANQDEEVTKVEKQILSSKYKIKNQKLNLLDYIKDVQTLPKYLQNNLNLAINLLKYLNLSTNNLALCRLKGRCQHITPYITIDVGHNPLAAKVLLQEFSNQKINLIYNSFKNKDYKAVLTILKPIICKLYIIDINDKQIASKDDIIKVSKELDIEYDVFTSIKNNTKYLVFGSFKVVEKFLNLSKDSLDYE